MRKRDLAWVDLETTGLDQARDGITELSIVITTRRLVEVESFDMLIMPDHMANPPGEWVSDHTAYDPATWQARGAVPFARVRHRVVSLMSGRCPAGQNVNFDLGFLKHALGGDRPWNRRSVDLMTLSLPLIESGMIESRSLAAVATALGVDRGRAHSASDDIRATIECARRIMACFDLSRLSQGDDIIVK